MYRPEYSHLVEQVGVTREVGAVAIDLDDLAPVGEAQQARRTARHHHSETGVQLAHRGHLREIHMRVREQYSSDRWFGGGGGHSLAQMGQPVMEQRTAVDAEPAHLERGGGVPDPGEQKEEGPGGLVHAGAPQ